MTVQRMIVVLIVVGFMTTAMALGDIKTELGKIAEAQQECQALSEME